MSRLIDSEAILTFEQLRISISANFAARTWYKPKTRSFMKRFFRLLVFLARLIPLLAILFMIRENVKSIKEENSEEFILRRIKELLFESYKL